MTVNRFTFYRVRMISIILSNSLWSSYDVAGIKTSVRGTSDRVSSVFFYLPVLASLILSSAFRYFGRNILNHMTFLLFLKIDCIKDR